MLFCKLFIDESVALRPAVSAVSLSLTAQSRRRERRHRAGRVRPSARGLGQYWRHRPNELKLRFFSKQLLGLSLCTCYGKKAVKKGSESC